MPDRFEMTVLSRDDVAGLLPSVEDQLDLVERTCLAMARGAVELPPKPGIHPRKNAFIHAMPAYLRDDDVAAIKWVSGYPSNRVRDLPYITGVIVVNDPDTGIPVGLLDAAEITAARTAAVSGVCMRRFAPSGWQRVAILGCGEQGQYHAAIVAALNPGATIRAFDPDTARAHQLPGSVDVVEDPADAVRAADVIVTAGPILEDPSPAISAAWLPPRCLLLPIDFDFYFQASAIDAVERFIVDDLAQYTYYRGQGHFIDWPEPDASLGEALALDITNGRTACVNLGVGALDAAYAASVLNAAAVRGLGRKIEL